MEQEGNPDLKGFVSYWKQNESPTSSMLEIYWEKGARIIGEDGSSVIDEALLAETLAEMKQMMDDGVTASGIETFGTKEARDVMCAGGAVFARDWLSGYGPFNNAETSQVAGDVYKRQVQRTRRTAGQRSGHGSGRRNRRNLRGDAGAVFKDL